MRKALFTLALVLSAATTASAQDVAQQSTSGGGADMAGLIKDGFEIKSAVQNGKNVIVFLQKDTTAFVCEFSSLQSSRCGPIN